MVKILQLVLVLMFLVFAMPQAFSQEQNKSDLPYYEKLKFYFDIINIDLIWFT